MMYLLHLNAFAYVYVCSCECLYVFEVCYGGRMPVNICLDHIMRLLLSALQIWLIVWWWVISLNQRVCVVGWYYVIKVFK